LDKSILKSEVAAERVFDYKPKEFAKEVSAVAINFVQEENNRKNEFQISELVAQQSGVQLLEEEKSQGLINDQVLERLKEVQERAYKEAYDLGHQEGTAKAFADEKANLAAKLKALDELLLSIEALKRDLMRDNEAQLVQMTFEIGKRIALRDLSQNQEAIVLLFQKITAELQSEQKIVVHAATADVKTLEEMVQRTETMPEAMKKMRIIAENDIQPGGCVIDLQYGDINLTVPDRVERVWQGLQEQIHINQKS
jgi:flagellar assembly protein FliH